MLQKLMIKKSCIRANRWFLRDTNLSIIVCHFPNDDMMIRRLYLNVVNPGISETTKFSVIIKMVKERWKGMVCKAVKEANNV